MNVKLKRAIKSEGRTQVWISKQLGVSTTRISRIIHGTQQATGEEKRQLSKLLLQTNEELFGRSEESASQTKTNALPSDTSWRTPTE